MASKMYTVAAFFSQPAVVRKLLSAFDAKGKSIHEDTPPNLSRLHHRPGLLVLDAHGSGTAGRATRSPTGRTTAGATDSIADASFVCTHRSEV